LGCENLSLNDRKVDLDLIQPTCVSGSMDELQLRVPRILLPETLDSGLPAMDGAVIYNPKDTSSVLVGRPRHYLFHQTIKRSDAICGFTPAEDSGVVDIQCTEVNPGAAALVSIRDAGRPPWLTGLSRMDAAAGLNARLLVGADHEFIGF